MELTGSSTMGQKCTQHQKWARPLGLTQLCTQGGTAVSALPCRDCGDYVLWGGLSSVSAHLG